MTANYRHHYGRYNSHTAAISGDSGQFRTCSRLSDDPCSPVRLLLNRYELRSAFLSRPLSLRDLLLEVRRCHLVGDLARVDRLLVRRAHRQRLLVLALGFVGVDVFLRDDLLVMPPLELSSCGGD